MITGFHFESAGRLDDRGLLPLRYLERRGRREWAHDFSPPEQAHDRLSVLRQSCEDSATQFIAKAIPGNSETQ